MCQRNFGHAADLSTSAQAKTTELQLLGPPIWGAYSRTLKVSHAELAIKDGRCKQQMKLCVNRIAFLFCSANKN